ncbi:MULTISPECIES: ABC transporter ATP-binding protein [Flavobacterium]|jgi:phospholipid/cholesterol/gamma-HCH transport system ATP-binding protein|uniref:ABC transporter ATP-binding protein n=1 Tax=Flavobacterium TaxID=237 RepID=UPI0006FEDE22|nr:MULTISPECIES: ATP-binding cassette domain-containing protein [Flavobacterium]PZO26378.1 MAG: ABC transporter ATP-binding protein [Flavobacteriaceae bacterium]THD31376.1 MAG: ATP-binding cassette domain-containing protein [Flavobacterium johnsoniae]KQS48801.1 ABC transporter ATP-binding protein [Flavobacterium sp. Leaf359]MBL7866657.1 ATP-binding cassette domain-containing protein [Flavobacterium lindanitolerans]MDQ7959830.1 ATP-binding cassette domain-containing protein [Flavobacterium lind
MIEVKDIKKSFGDAQILKGISTTFEAGKTNLIIGRSGSGKTVLLKTLLGIHTPDEGTISFNGKIYSELSKDEKRELRTEIGMVFQGSALFDSMTVEENVGFPLKMFTNKKKNEIRDRVNQVLERVNLVDANNKYPSEISGGMQKRVAIARAIVNNPKYLFCDEPNSGLDPETSILIDVLIQEITKEYNMTTVINTHDMNSVLQIGEKIVFLKNGIKEWEGTNEEILETKNKSIVEFVYSSDLFKKVRESLLADIEDEDKEENK